MKTVPPPTSRASRISNEYARAKAWRLTASNCSKMTATSWSDTRGSGRRAGPDHLGELLEAAHVLLEVAVHRRDDHPVDARVGEVLDPLGDLVLGADHRGGVDQLVGNGRIRFLALAVEVERLHLVGDLGEAEAAGQVRVEVGLLGAHAAEVEQQPGSHQAA